MKNDKIANPTKYFCHPDEAHKDDSLSTEDKLILFANWLDDINLKQIAETESMISTKEGARNYTKEIILKKLMPSFTNINSIIPPQNV